MKNKYILTITLNPAIDKTVYCDNFTLNMDHRCKDIFSFAGGKGINVSRVLNQFSVPTLASGCVGGASGDYILSQLQKEKIEHRFCHIANETRTSLTIIDKKTNHNTRLLEHGPSITPEERVKFLTLLSIIIKDASWLVLSGRSLPDVGDDFYQKIIETASLHNVKTVLDSSGNHFKKGLYSKPYFVKPNIEEAQELLGYKLDSDESIFQACKSILNRGIQNVCISRGSKGAVLYDGQQFYIGEVPKLKEESPVGCGDAFIAGFLMGNFNSLNIEESFKTALACGAANALNNHPGHIQINEFKKIRSNIKITKK